MKQEYKIAEWFKVFARIFFPACMACFAVLPVIPFIEYKFNIGHALFYIIFTVMLEALMIIGLLQSVRSRLIIEQDWITSTGIFKTKKLALSQINGFRKNGHFLQFIPVSKNLDKIYVSSFIGDYDMLQAWAEKNLKNLDIEETESDEEDILNNGEFGLTPEERKLTLSQSKGIVRFLNTISWISAFSIWFYPHFYKIQILVCCALPVIGLVVFQMSKGLVIIFEKLNSVRPDISSTLLIPSVALLTSALSEYNVIDYGNFLKPGIIIFVLTVIIPLKAWNSNNNSGNIKSYLLLIPVFLTGIMYAYGSVISTNAVFDKSSTEVFNVKILNKRISSGKGKTYYLMLESWGPQKETKDVQVSEAIYNTKSKEDYAIIHFRQGLYKIPYYNIIK